MSKVPSLAAESWLREHDDSVEVRRHPLEAPPRLAIQSAERAVAAERSELGVEPLRFADRAPDRGATGFDARGVDGHLENRAHDVVCFADAHALGHRATCPRARRRVEREPASPPVPWASPTSSSTAIAFFTARPAACADRVAPVMLRTSCPGPQRIVDRLALVLIEEAAAADLAAVGLSVHHDRHASDPALLVDADDERDRAVLADLFDLDRPAEPGITAGTPPRPCSPVPRPTL